MADIYVLRTEAEQNAQMELIKGVVIGGLITNASWIIGVLIYWYFS